MQIIAGGGSDEGRSSRYFLMNTGCVLDMARLVVSMPQQPVFMHQALVRFSLPAGKLDSDACSLLAESSMKELHFTFLSLEDPEGT